MQSSWYTVFFNEKCYTFMKEEENWQPYHDINQITNTETVKKSLKNLDERISTLAHTGGGDLITGHPL